MTPVKLFKMPSGPVIKKPDEVFTPKKAVPVMSSVSFDKVTQSIIANQLALNCNEALKYTGYYKKELKAHLNKTIPLLIKAESEEFDKIFDSQPGAASDVYNVMDALVKEIAATSIPEYSSIIFLIQAYRKDPKSIKGIVNRVLKNAGK